MAGNNTGERIELYDSAMTVPSDSENYSAHNELSSSPPSTSSSPLILYKPPTFWGLVRGAAINVLLPFVNGLMLGLGELLAHEAAFRLGWSGTKVGWLLFTQINGRFTDLDYRFFLLGDALRLLGPVLK